MANVPADQVDKDLKFYVERVSSPSTAHLVPLARLVYANHAAVVACDVPTTTTTQRAYVHAEFPDHRGVERVTGEERKYGVYVVHRARTVGKAGLVKKWTAMEQAKVERDAALERMRQLEVFYGEVVKSTGADHAMV
ncbi:hypothetical protein AMAG_20410 [Allomyces macrogynus ATCC 38327]|uniref:Uncharacterized protein n=1 Tax=Allomyces macrogynus (strain ATCC 38327) TaxID=578462 RepID=A0A0L0T8Q8_ALLM3|nr:hypothetical protein AMAG_20410 [Allomyces macrogynus ATCC 38327]|eukprot:KNE71193.1 hypothetical protein AMAG_20410 [Allomyces macrogynus ATCC 38327]